MNAHQSTASITAVVFGSFDLEPIHADIIIKIMPIISNMSFFVRYLFNSQCSFNTQNYFFELIVLLLETDYLRSPALRKYNVFIDGNSINGSRANNDTIEFFPTIILKNCL